MDVDFNERYRLAATRCRQTTASEASSSAVFVRELAGGLHDGAEICDVLGLG